MQLSEFNVLIGQDSYVRCREKIRVDSAIVPLKKAKAHIENGATIGWWVRSGYIVVDIDEAQDVAIAAVKALGIKTLMCKTAKGIHLYFKTDKVLPQKISMITPFGLKCDFRCANKGYVLLPFNTPGRKFNKVKEISELSIEFTPLLNRKESLYNLKEGDGRNATLFAHLMAYKNRGASDEQIDKMAEVINDIVFKQPMAQKELEKIIENTKRYVAEEQGENPYLIYNSKGAPVQVNYRAITDYFVNRGDTFVLGGECYLYCDGVYTEASSHVRNTIRDMIVVDSFITQARIMECFRLIIDDTRLQRKPEELNADSNLINFKNGVWDIQNSELLPHDSKYLQTIQLPHEIKEYCPFTQTRLYDFFSKTSLHNDDIKMLLAYLAYCMTLNKGLKTFMILCGQSNTGKSVLLRFIEALVGKSNTAALSMSELSMRFYPSQLYGRLLNACGDNGALPLTSIENLKKITGGDEIMHEKKGKEPFFFVPFTKLIFSFNQLPLQLEEKSNAFYKRMRILYMNKELFLNNEYVDWLCSDEGVQEIIPYLLKLLPIKAIPRTRISNRYVEGLHQDSDSIHAFVTKWCILNEDSYVDKQALFAAYVEYCVANGRECHKKHSFIRALRSQGFLEYRNPETREACWKGIALRNKSRR